MSYPIFHIPITLIEQDLKSDLEFAKKKLLEESKRVCIFTENIDQLKGKKRQISKTVKKYSYKNNYI